MYEKRKEDVFVCKRNDSTCSFTTVFYLFPIIDSSVYAHLVFRAFDVTSCGAITFKVINYIILLSLSFPFNAQFYPLLE